MGGSIGASWKGFVEPGDAENLQPGPVEPSLLEVFGSQNLGLVRGDMGAHT